MLIAMPPPLRSRVAAQRLVLALPVAGLVAAGWAQRWITDDGFIYLRVVRQIAAGNGPVFNAGERVEAFTGVLWVALLALADLVTPLRLEWLAVGLGLAGSAAGLALAIAGSRRLWGIRRGEAWLLPGGAVVFAAVLPAWRFVTSGLETGLAFAWLGGCLWLLARFADSPARTLSLPGTMLLGLGWLVRPDLALFSLGFLVVLLAAGAGGGFREKARTVGAMLGLPLLYQVFRMGFYGSVVANTAIAKEAARANWERGWIYLRDFADPYWLWLPAVALLAAGYLPLAVRLAASRRRRALAIVAAFALCAGLHGAYMVGVGGDYLHARLLLLGFFGACAPVAVVPATRRHLAGLVLVPWAAAAVLWLRPPQLTTPGRWLIRGVALPDVRRRVEIEDFGWGESGGRRRWYRGPAYYRQVGMLWYERADVTLAPHVRLPVAAIYTVGMAGYAMGTEFHVIDVLGLADPLTAHLETTPSATSRPRLAGHEKPLPAPWLAARLTPAEALVVPEHFPVDENPLIPPTTGRAFREQVAWARAALACGEIAELTRAATEPLTPRRFAANLLRAYDNARVRIPPDPEQAYRRFCGPGTPREVLAARAGP